MPKEQGHLGEWSTHRISKNAKDKSNRSILWASHGGIHRQQSGMGDVSGHMLHCHSEKDSEKDSGYSETGSDFVHTDVDDQRSSVSEPHRESSKTLDSNSVNGANNNITTYEELTPIYIFKNLVVKSSRPEQLLHGPLEWGGGWHSLTSGKAPTQLLLIQQPTVPTPASTTTTPLSCLAPPQGNAKKGGNRSNHGSKNSYLPILNSYPRIAPHPTKDIFGGKGTTWVKGVKESSNEGQSQRKRVCTEGENRETVSTSSHLLRLHHQNEGRVYCQHNGREGHTSYPSTSHCPLLSYTASTTQHKSYHSQPCSGSGSIHSSSISSSKTPSPPSSSDSPSSSSPPSSSPSSSAAHSPYCLAPDCLSTRHRRFLNTAEILNQSGLLAITLRTKELLKQNAATEKEIAQLRHHTHLLCHVTQVRQNGSNEGSDSLDKLLQAMSESSSYPNLDLNHLKTLSSSCQQSKTRNEEDQEKDNIGGMNTHCSPIQVVSLHNIDDGTSPPSPLLAPSPDTEEIEYTDCPVDPMSTTINVYFPRSDPE
ncbi:CLOCK-interacting pacemaker-like [Acanthochromis polyacanthus]|uniref:CLOCK-interacting pacemaker-like n=1 Tax=Acanthochromis polyacanthus TaxID=80966 RepID=A0A3Q1FYH5_9TELE|nr:CLOCK-interacting pacemaker-like [Acanthochromis polyacanthus]XP_022076734.1 CLOCK-interacting pacemaker-like [Acanthochromis polyacanthus]